MKLARKQIILLISVFLLFLTSSSVVADVSFQAEQTKQLNTAVELSTHYYHLEQSLVILYDSTNSVTEDSALSLLESLSLMTPNVVGIPIRSLSEIKQTLDSRHYTIAIYVFHSMHQAIIIDENVYGWNIFAETLLEFPKTKHILSMGNTKQLLAAVNYTPNVFGSNEEVIDAQTAFVYTLWTIADILEQEKQDPKALAFANDVRMATLSFFANNFNELVTAAVQPSIPLGIEAPETKQTRIDEYFAEHPRNAERIAANETTYKSATAVYDNQSKRMVNPDTGDYVYPSNGIDIYPKSSSGLSDFILSAVPISSGLEGPIGGIVDIFLDLLIDEVGDALGIDGEKVEQIAEILTSIPELIGAIKDPSSSKIKKLIDKIAPMLPIPRDMRKYIDLLVDALFMLRGSTDDILNFVVSAVETLLPDFNIPGVGSLSNILKSIFNLASGLARDPESSSSPNALSKIASGGVDDVISFIMSILNENMLSNLTQTLIGDISSEIGATGAQITSMIQKITGYVKLAINFISTFSVKDLLLEYGPQLLTTAFSELGLSQKATNMTFKGITLLLAATNVISDITVKDGLISFLQDAVPSGLVDKAKKIEQAVTGIMNEITTVINTASSDVAGFKSLIETKMNELDVSTSLKEGISDAMTLVVAVTDENFDITSGPQLTNLTTMLGKILTDVGLSQSVISTINKIATSITGIVALIKNPPNLKEILGNALQSLNTQQLLENFIKFVINNVFSALPARESNPTADIRLATAETVSASPSLTPETERLIQATTEGMDLIFSIIGQIQDNSVQGILMTLLEGATYVISQITDVDIQAYVEVAKSLFGKWLGVADEVPSVSDIMALITEFIPPSILGDIRPVIDFLVTLTSVFTDGFRSIFGKLSEWILGQVSELIGSLTGSLGDIFGGAIELLNLEIPIELCGFSLFTIKIYLGLELGIEIAGEKLGTMIYDLIFKGTSMFTGDAASILREALSFISISPILVARFDLTDFGSGESSFMNFLLETLGLQLTFSGYGFFKLMLFTFKNGSFSMENFFKVVEWGFGFDITISKTLTLLDFITGGVGGGLNAIGKYIGLDAISITIFLGLGLDIIKRAAMGDQPESGSLTLEITIGFTVNLGIDILIACLEFSGTLIITLTFLQDLVNPSPMRAFIGIELIITVTIGFLFWDWDFDFHWSPSGNPKELTSGSKQEAKDKGAMGVDSDNDGLSDQYESTIPGLNANAVDTDGDGLTDKFETQTYNTDPVNADSDGDGLDDGLEFDLKTDPNNPDSDFDGLDDYNEVSIIGTNPLGLDTDGDGLDDYYEVNHAYNMTKITPSITEIIIGGVIYNDRTDPLNPDTDNDGLLDGEEDTRGIYYGPSLYNATETVDPVTGQPNGGTYTPTDPVLIFNQGYTHPLDNDTDDDSYEQTYDGAISPRYRWLRDMSDFTEIHGIYVIFYDPESGEPLEPRIVRTNPVNPDSDGDTGVTEYERTHPPFGFFLNSDGYELALNPPTDPLDGDTDDDGLIDGYEGILRPDGNHTNAINPDTDGDGLGDMQELQLGTDARSVDTDLDGICDGDEFFIFGTNPFMEDTDSDGLEDGEEVWTYHCNPFLRDSDADGLNDYDEIWRYFSNPMDEDSDNDFLTDYEEVFIYYTDAWDSDTDDDGLLDGEEILGLPYYSPNGTVFYVKTDPTKWDTDNDSIRTLDQYGQMSMSMSDGDEFLLSHTRPDITDTDMDGISDGWELWLGKGIIPNMAPIKLDPLSNDTDKDGLGDGSELRIENKSTLLNPYIGFYLVFPHNTSAVLADTDGDLLSDYNELMVYRSNPAAEDSDNDTLHDYEEIFFYFTEPGNNDTDGDGLLDWEEIGPLRVYPTDPTNSDTDGDLLPDGAEIFLYGKDPVNPDQNMNGYLDGMEIDSDGDGLMDGEEYYVYCTFTKEGGGPFQPDSDHDGLFDGYEVFVTHTSPVEWSTDNDTFSDGLEWYVGTDPLTYTTDEEMLAALAAYVNFIHILSPVHTYEYATTAIPVLVYDGVSNPTAMQYRYRDTNSSSWSLASALTKDIAKPDYWYGPSVSLPQANATYELEVSAAMPDASVKTTTVTFTVEMNPDQFTILSPLNMTYKTNTLPIKVKAGINFNSTWFRIYSYTRDTWTPNTTLSYDNGLACYYLAAYSIAPTYSLSMYKIQVFGQKTNGDIIVKEIIFSTDVPNPAAPLDVVAVVIVTGSIAALGGGGFFAFRRYRHKLPYFRRGG